MDDKKAKQIKRQRFVIRTFWITLTATVAFWLGTTLSQSYMSKCEWGYEYIHHFPDEWLMLLIAVTGIVFIVMIAMFIAIGKNPKPKTTDTLEQIEKLGKLKEQGHISEEEFEKEKKKLWDND